MMPDKDRDRHRALHRWRVVFENGNSEIVEASTAEVSGGALVFWRNAPHSHNGREAVLWQSYGQGAWEDCRALLDEEWENR